MTDKPFVLVVDDDPNQELFALQLSKFGLDAKHVLPEDVTIADIKRASLLVVDEFIENWPTRESLKESPALYVSDGIALSAVLRAHLERRGSSISESVPSKTAIVLRTGQLEHLSRGLPKYLWSLAVAGRHDLEWVAAKTLEQAAALGGIAFAAAELPSLWEPANPEPQLSWLALAQVSWRAEALAQIEQCRPPWSALSSTSAGRLWLAWFLQRILPFPTFLVDDLRAASYLGLKPSALDPILNGKTEVSQILSSALYTGHLSEFSGRRWWRAGIGALRRLVLETADDRSLVGSGRRIAEMQNEPLEQLGLKFPVFTIDYDYTTATNPIEITEAVRLQPDGWPSYADDPWLAVEDIRDEPELAKLIVIDDRLDESNNE